MNTASRTIEPTGFPRTNPLNLYAIVLACATFVLVLAGGLVTSTGSGLAVPDWPLSLGQFFPPMEGGVLYEHSHRLIAGTVALLTIVFAIWLWRREERATVRYLGVTAVAVVLLQATLGGITVLYRLPDPISIAHATLGQIFFSLVISLAVLTSRREVPHWPAGRLSKVQRLALMTLGFIFLQLLAGATVRHTGKGMHAHLLGAVLVAVHVTLFARRTLLDGKMPPGFRAVAAALPLVLMLQFVLGYFSWLRGPVLMTTAHVGIGALILAGTVILSWESFREAS